MGNSKDSNSIWSILKKIGFDTSIDHIWKERNNKIFTQERKSYNQVLQSIIENIRPQLMSLSVKKSTNNLKFAKVWEVGSPIDEGKWFGGQCTAVGGKKGYRYQRSFQYCPRSKDLYCLR
ncbi:hypothetical protein Tco_0527730 [Tanacetum coccineum]